MTGGTAFAPAMPTLRFRLPGQWWAVSLANRDEAVVAAGRLVRRRIGTLDEHAALRGRVRRDMVAAIDAAIEGAGQSMFMAIEIVEAVPLPITITVYLPDVSLSPAIGVEAARVLDVLRQGLERFEHPEAGDFGELRDADVGGVPALCSERTRTLTVGDGEDAGELETLMVDYWVPVPETKRVALVNFSTSMAGLREHLVPFFDAIMRVTYWESAPSL